MWLTCGCFADNERHYKIMCLKKQKKKPRCVWHMINNISWFLTDIVSVVETQHVIIIIIVDMIDRY